MQRYSRILGTLALLAITGGCMRVCPSPQSLLSIDWQGNRCKGEVLTGFEVRSSGLHFEILRAQRDLHVCLVVEESH